MAGQRASIVRAIADTLALAPSMLIAYFDLDEDAIPYCLCKDCGSRRPQHAFTPVKGTDYVYRRCRFCHARRARENCWSDPEERQRQVARASRNNRRRRLAQRAVSA